MIRRIVPLESTVSLSRARHVDAACDQFEQALLANEQPRLEQFLAESSGQERPALLREMLLIELEYRLRRGETPSLAEYEHRFPSFARGVEDCIRKAVERFEQDRPDPAGRTIAHPTAIGRFQIVSLLGRGGFGTVYKAIDSELSRAVAVKIPHVSCVWGSENHERLLREARSAAGLRHEGIVKVHEIGRHLGMPYIVSDYVKGSTLAEVLENQGLNQNDSVALLLKVAKALNYAHRTGIVHRDIKPSNILIDSTGEPHLADFGLARSDQEQASLTQEGQVLGTPAYMSPEQAAGNGRVVDHRSDIYSLGVVLYEMLTGEVPAQENKTMLMRQLLNEQPTPSRRLAQEVDGDLRRIVMKCLAKRPSRRYATAAQLADDLHAFLSNEPVEATELNPLKRVVRAVTECDDESYLGHFGLTLMAEGVTVLVISLIAHGMQWAGLVSQSPYLLLWALSFPVCFVFCWRLLRLSGPLFVGEFRISQIWIGVSLACGLAIVVEAALGLPALTLSPVFALLIGNVSFLLAGIVSPGLYLQSAAFFACALLMAAAPDWRMAIFGIVGFAAFFFPGLYYYRVQRQSRQSYA